MRSIQEICSKDHTPEEIRAWGHRPYSESQRINAIQNDHVWVVDDHGSIEGYGHLTIFEKDGVQQAYVMGLYLTSKVAGQSLGRKIMDLMMLKMKEAKVQKVILKSTLTARLFYRKLGFTETGPEKTVEIGGTPIRCYPKEMSLE